MVGTAPLRYYVIEGLLYDDENYLYNKGYDKIIDGVMQKGKEEYGN